MDHEEYRQAARYWTERDRALPAAERMDAAALRTEIDSFLASHNTLALAPCAHGIPRCTPLEYGWRDGAFWIFSEGGLKFLGLEPSTMKGTGGAITVSCAVFEPYAGFGTLQSAQITGRARVIDPEDPAFTAAAAAKGIPATRLPMLARRLHLIKVTPTEVDYLDSALKEQGLATRQHLVL